VAREEQAREFESRPGYHAFIYYSSTELSAEFFSLKDVY